VCRSILDTRDDTIREIVGRDGEAILLIGSIARARQRERERERERGKERDEPARARSLLSDFRLIDADRSGVVSTVEEKNKGWEEETRFR